MHTKKEDRSQTTARNPGAGPPAWSPAQDLWNEPTKKMWMALEEFPSESRIAVQRVQELLTGIDSLLTCRCSDEASRLVPITEQLIEVEWSRLFETRPIAEMAEIMGVTSSWIYQLRRTGEIPERDFGGHAVVTLADMKRYRRKTQTTEENEGSIAIAQNEPEPPPQKAASSTKEQDARRQLQHAAGI